MKNTIFYDGDGTVWKCEIGWQQQLGLNWLDNDNLDDPGTILALAPSGSHSQIVSAYTCQATFELYANEAATGSVAVISFGDGSAAMNVQIFAGTARWSTIITHTYPMQHGAPWTAFATDFVLGATSGPSYVLHG